MSAGHPWKSGITPTVQRQLDVAARAIKRAIAAVERARQATEEDSDADWRCDNALEMLHIAQEEIEWTPPVDDAGPGGDAPQRPRPRLVVSN